MNATLEAALGWEKWAQARFEFAQTLALLGGRGCDVEEARRDYHLGKNCAASLRMKIETGEAHCCCTTPPHSMSRHSDK